MRDQDPATAFARSKALDPRSGVAWKLLRFHSSITRSEDMSKRELISPNGDKRFVRRDESGRFSESDDVGRSLSSDRRRKAKTASKPGQGDRGDRR
jgi:hypothetical protein